MTRIIKIFYSAAAFAMLSSAVSAQNLHQSVEVTNVYEGKVMEVNKMELPMNIPDSISTFDYKFDYSVFDNPYNGSYEFHPYLISMKPDPSPYSGKNLYFRAGAGYSFKPEAQLVFSPDQKKNFRFSLYDFFDGYGGDYKYLASDWMEYIKYGMLYNKDGKTFNGHEYSNRFGVNMRLDTDDVAFTFDADYHFISVRDTSYAEKWSYGNTNSTINAFDAVLGFNSKNTDGVFYKGYLSGGFLRDDIKLNGSPFALGELKASAKFDTGYNIGESGMVDFDSGIDFYSYSMTLDAYSANLYIIPHFTFEKGVFHLKAGVRASYLLSKDNGYPRGSFGQKKEMFRKKSQIFYPDVHVSFDVYKNHLQLYADLSGYERINDFSSLIERNRFFNPVFSKTYSCVMENMVVPFDVRAGIRGSLFDRLQFDFKASYTQYQNYCNDAVYFEVRAVNPDLAGTPFFAYNDLNIISAEATASWKSEHVELEGGLILRKTDADLDKVVGILDANMEGGGSAMFNIAGRIFIGGSCYASTGRKGYNCPIMSDLSTMDVKVPSFVNLGARAEFRFNGNFSVWASGNNLLNNICGPYFLHPEGVSVTGGLCLNL